MGKTQGKKQRMRKGEGKHKTFWLDFFFNKLFSWLSFLERGVKMVF